MTAVTSHANALYKKPEKVVFYVSQVLRVFHLRMSVIRLTSHKQGRRKIDNWGGGGGRGHIFIYSCSQTVKPTILKSQFLKKLIWHNTSI